MCDKTKFLGVIIDKKLSWKEHISYICGKVAKGIGIISKVRKHLNENTFLDLYYLFKYPYLTYCKQVWGLSCQSYMNALVRLRKIAVKIIWSVHPRTHTDPLFTELKLLKRDEIIKYLVGRPIYWIYNEDNTLYDSMVMKNVQFHNHDICQRDRYHIPGFKSRLGKIKLRYNGVIVWNNILSSGVPVDASQVVFFQTIEMCCKWWYSHFWNIFMILIPCYVNVVIHPSDNSFDSALYVDRNLEILKYLQQMNDK